MIHPDDLNEAPAAAQATGSIFERSVETYRKEIASMKGAITSLTEVAKLNVLREDDVTDPAVAAKATMKVMENSITALTNRIKLLTDAAEILKVIGDLPKAAINFAPSKARGMDVLNAALGKIPVVAVGAAEAAKA